ncbi:unnamed protein product [Caenorhabditis sp. 36 PRJEB53466]|nr:unnamed protein product [Caenorhabditis sp. 36 PRJEB53466]
MPPKKKVKESLSEDARKRRLFNRKHNAVPPCVILENRAIYLDDDDPLYASRYQNPAVPKQRKKAAKKEEPKKVLASPVVSDVEVSDDEEGAGFVEPEAQEEDRQKINKLKQQFEDEENVSLEVFNSKGMRVKIVNGRYVGEHDKQPPEAWRPSCEEEVVGNFPPTEPPKRHPLVKKQNIKKQEKPQPAAEPKKSATGLDKCIDSIRNDLEVTKRRDRAAESASMSFRVFATPMRKTVEPRDDRLSMFNYTPMRGNQMNNIGVSNRISTLSENSPKPQFESTPIGKPTRTRRTEQMPAFNLSSSDEASFTEKGKTTTREKSKYSDTQMTTAVEPTIVKEASCSLSFAPEDSTMQAAKEIMSLSERTEQQTLIAHETLETASRTVQPIPDVFVDDSLEQQHESTSSRKADLSVSEILVDSEAEQMEQETEQFSKKRQRTKSPETMCLATSTILTMQEVEAEEKENQERKRTTLQPQTQQLLRESRLSVMTTASSRRESINSLMEDMSLDMSLDMGDEMMKTQGSECTTRGGTAMTIHNEGADIPFYLREATLLDGMTDMQQLLHVVGQTEPKQWKNLPKEALFIKNVKKLGEGSYGEVYSTIWNGDEVALKIVPFEADAENRLYDGVYNGNQMQAAFAILPEVIVMKELSALRNMDEENSTPNFIHMISAEVVVGLYPKGLQRAWDAYMSSKPDKCMNDRPEDFVIDQQKFILYVTANGGKDLEDFVLESEEELRSILVQLLISMQVAEKVLEFEHRDLHLGNVLIDRSGVEQLQYKINGHKVDVSAHKVKVNIIDFTLSRISKEGTTVFPDLENDPEIFEGSGDPQFDVYREMRKNNGGNWMKFDARTNLMWIKYLALQLIEPPRCPDGMLTNERKNELRELFERLGRYETSANSFVDEEFFNLFYRGYIN